MSGISYLMPRTCGRVGLSKYSSMSKPTARVNNSSELGPYYTSPHALVGSVYVCVLRMYKYASFRLYCVLSQIRYLHVCAMEGQKVEYVNMSFKV